MTVEEAKEIKNKSSLADMYNYQQYAATFLTEKSNNYVYLMGGLASEAGEVCGKIAKYIRDANSFDDLTEGLKLELGDLLWFVAMLGKFFGNDLDEIAYSNLLKLADRKERDKINGSGDHR